MERIEKPGSASDLDPGHGGSWPADPGAEPRPGSPLLAVGVGWMSSRPRLRLAVRLGELGLVLTVTLVTLPGSATSTVLIGVLLCGLAWLAWIAAGDRRLPVAAALVVMAAAGGVDEGAARHTGLIFVGVSAAGAAFAFDLLIAIVLVSPALVTFAIVAVAQGSFSLDRLSTLAAVALLGIVSGGGRRQLLQRGRQVTMLATAQQRAALAWHEADLIAERNRLGRELHDVLAHTLGAVSIQLTALDSRVAAGDAPAAVRERVGAIHRLVGEGLGEARDAVGALRGDGVALDRQLRRLCDPHGAAFEVSGHARTLGPEATLTLYRVAQEALTNADKHAPKALVSVHLTFDTDVVGIRIDNGRSAPAASSPLAASGGGHGLDGMRERVQLAGGGLKAGPTADGWQVSAEIPCR